LERRFICGARRKPPLEKGPAQIEAIGCHDQRNGQSDTAEYGDKFERLDVNTGFGCLGKTALMMEAIGAPMQRVDRRW
jgi:hypothetical protein